MCQAFSCLITKSNNVYWEAGIDSHDELQKKFVKQDDQLKDDKEPPHNTFARIEITPKNGNYLKPRQPWIFKIDEKVKPFWVGEDQEKECRKALVKWKKKVYSLINLEKARKLIHPFKIKPPKEITKKHLDLLKEWASVGVSVKDSVGVSVEDSVWVSVWDSVEAYIGAIFNLKEWKYTEKLNIKGYPFQSAVKLWKMGLVPSYDGNVWRLHSKNGIAWEGKINKLK